MAAIAADAFFIINRDMFFFFLFLHSESASLADFNAAFTHDAFLFIKIGARHDDITYAVVEKFGKSILAYTDIRNNLDFFSVIILIVFFD